MKKLFLSLFLLAFVSVSFSATVFKPVENVVKKELVKSFENEKIVSVVAMPTFESNDFVKTFENVYLDTGQVACKNTFIRKNILKTTPKYDTKISWRFSEAQNYNKEKPDISG